MGGDVTIRAARYADRAAIVDMGLAFLASTRYGPVLAGYTRAHLAALVDVGLAWSPAQGALLLAERAGQAVGLLAVMRVHHPVMGRWYADEVVWWVDPSARTARIGPALLAAAEYWARSSDLPLIKLVAPTGSRVGAFLERRGYLAVETSFLKELGDGLGRIQGRQDGDDRAVHAGDGPLGDRPAGGGAGRQEGR